MMREKCLVFSYPVYTETIKTQSVKTPTPTAITLQKLYQFNVIQNTLLNSTAAISAL